MAQSRLLHCSRRAVPAMGGSRCLVSAAGTPIAWRAIVVVFIEREVMLLLLLVVHS